MRIQPGPIYRKVIIPWYDGDLFCKIALSVQLIVFYFGLTGIWAANETPAYQEYVWVPRVLTAISALGAASLVLRLAARYADRDRDYE